MDVKAEPDSKDVELFAEETHEQCCPRTERPSSSRPARPTEAFCKSAKSCMSATDSAIVGTSLCKSEGRPLWLEARYLAEWKLVRLVGNDVAEGDFVRDRLALVGRLALVRALTTLPVTDSCSPRSEKSFASSAVLSQ